MGVLRALPHPMDRSALVFGNRNGKVWDRLRKRWANAVAAAGIEDFRFHDPRHTFASRLATRGVDLAVLRELLGHRDFEMTLRYAHLAPSRLKEAVAVLVPNVQTSSDPSKGTSDAEGDYDVKPCQQGG